MRAPNPSEVFFRQQCDAAVQEAVREGRVCQETQPLKHISCVGALEMRFAANDKDSNFVTQMMRYLLKSGILIDPDFELDVVNFREGRDFLAEDNQTDLVFVNWIIREWISRVTTCFNKSEAMRASERALSVMLSPDHRDMKWDARAKRAGAKLIVTDGGRFEVSSQVFQSFRPLIHTPDNKITDGKESVTDLSEAVHGVGADYPFAWLGLVADPAYVDALSCGAQIAPKTKLAKDIAVSRSQMVAQNTAKAMPRP